LQDCREGGQQQLQNLPFTTTFEANFLGLDDSLVKLEAAETLWELTLADQSVAANVKARLLQDVEWFSATKQRYELIDLAMRYHLESVAGSAERAAILNAIDGLVTSLLANPVTDDTLSPVNQRSAIFSLYDRLAE
jgi:hypothetical protein